MAAGAAFSFGVTVVVNRSLATSGLGVAAALGVRFVFASAASFALLRALGRPLLPVPGERGRIVALGMVGYAGQASLFFLALERGTTAAVALLFYAYPAMVTLLERTFDRRRLVALALSAGGTVLVVAAGGRVSITPAGVVCALGAAAAFSGYLLVGDRLVVRTDTLTTAAWVGAGGAASLLTAAALSGGFDGVGAHWNGLALNGVATAAAFLLMFTALRRLGAGRTSVVMTLEAVFAIVLAAVFLDEGVRPLQALGGVAILAATVLVGRVRRIPAET